jgi:queuine tRNA-ribosyltransferase
MFFKVLSQDDTCGARVCEIKTEHGTLLTPAFMPVGTQGTVKAIEQRELDEAGVEIILANTYHLYLRPGTDVLEKAGGLHRFMNWNKPILTDSGGFQVFSLSGLRKVLTDGVEFRSHLDGTTHFFTPDKVIEIQRIIGSDIMMVLDECIENPASYDRVRESVELTTNWAKKSMEKYNNTQPCYGFNQYVFGIIQGSVFKDLRYMSVNELCGIGFDGYAIGGLAVGEESETMHDIASYTAELLPYDKPKYLMGVGTPEDLLNCIESGIDMFDCVLPTRNARNGTLFTSKGKIRIKNLENKYNFNPPDEELECYASGFSLAYLRHLFMCNELLAYQLATIHNINFYMKLMRDCRKAIIEKRFRNFKKNFLEHYSKEY